MKTNHKIRPRSVHSDRLLSASITMLLAVSLTALGAIDGNNALAQVTRKPARKPAAQVKRPPVYKGGGGGC